MSSAIRNRLHIFSIIQLIVLGLMVVAVSGCNIGRMAFRVNSRGAGGGDSSTGDSDTTPATQAKLDESFGNKGRLVLSISGRGRWDLSGGIDKQSSGKIVVAASTHDSADLAEHYNLVLARFDDKGNLDPSFGNNSSGYTSPLSASPGNPNSWVAKALKVLPDDSILVAGHYESLTTGSDFFLAKFSSQGIHQWSAFTNFTGTGSVNQNDFGTSIAIESGTNNIVVGGYTARSSGAMQMAAVKYNTSGAVLWQKSVEFNVNGNSVANAVVFQAGRILLAGYVKNGTHSDMAMARLDASTGSLDTTFGHLGTTKFDASSLAKDDVASAVVVLSDNKILLGGHSSNGSDSDMALARFDASGIIDASYGTNGRTLYNIDRGDYVTGMALVGDRVLVTGYSQRGIHFEFAALRLTAAGAVESKVTVKFPITNGVDARGYGRAALPIGTNGAIVLGEAYFGANTQFDLALAKITSM